MTQIIKQIYFFPNPVKIVWEYLINSELLEKWLMPNNFQPVLNHEFYFKTNPLPQFNCDGIFHCKILEIDPMKKLIYSWNAGSGNGTLSLKSIVEWTLVEKENGTELQLTHKGFTDENLAIYNAMIDGWGKNIQKIVNHLNNQ